MGTPIREWGSHLCLILPTMGPVSPGRAGVSALQHCPSLGLRSHGCPTSKLTALCNTFIILVTPTVLQNPM